MEIRRFVKGARRVSGTAIALGGLGAGAAAAVDVPYRLTTVDHDYDDNGVIDAQTVIEYDAGGDPTVFSYTYTGDGVPDLFVTQDDEATSEAGAFGFDAAGLTTSATLDRVNMDASTESFDTLQTFTGGAITRSDSDVDIEGSMSTTYSTFAYIGADLDSVETRDATTDALQTTMTFAYGGDSLPDIVTLSAPGGMGVPGLEVVTTYSWRADGQPDDVASTWSQIFSGGPVVFGGGTGDYQYDAAGRRIAEVFTVDTNQGAFVAEFFGREYRKTLSYDALGLLAMEEVDLNDDGSVEATSTATWEAGECTPAFVWAPNGRPEFVEMAGMPYVPGTGWQSLRNCPEPATGFSLMAGVWALAGLSRRRAARRGENGC